MSADALHLRLALSPAGAPLQLSDDEGLLPDHSDIAPWRFLLEHGADLPLADRARLLAGLLRLQLHEAGQPDGRMLGLSLRQGDDSHELQVEIGPPIDIESKWWGSVDVLVETGLAGLYRLNLVPGGRIPTHLHRQMDESELLLTDGLTGWSTASPTALLPRGRAVRWPKGLAHGYQNDSAVIQRILCIDRPPFDARDEVLLEPDAPAPAGPWQAP